MPLDWGIEIGRHARDLFPGGVLVDAKPWEHKSAVDQTRSLMLDPHISAIFEAAFEFAGVRIRTDILERCGKAWGLREVKLSTKPSADHVEDVAIQLFVLRGAGLRVNSAELIHVDKGYSRDRDGIDWTRYFKRTEVLRQASALRTRIAKTVQEQHAVVRRMTAPKIEPSGHCGEPNSCEFWGLCTKKRPKDWILYLPRLSAKRFSQLQDRNVHSIRSIPSEFPLSKIQKRIREVLRTRKPFISAGLAEALKAFGPPAFYLDFETVNPPVPLYTGTRPYQRIPFQWSLHNVGRGGEIWHKGFLADGDADPRMAFIETLVEALDGSDWPILVYSGYEQAVINELIEYAPRRLKAGLRRLLPRLRDLLAVVREHLYHPDFQFSYSIKAVAPALSAAVRYDDLSIVSNGTEASEAFLRLAMGRLNPGEEEDSLRKAMVSYCHRDTLAMVVAHGAIAGFGHE
jgi:Domain of unknown function(DUF2779)